MLAVNFVCAAVKLAWLAPGKQILQGRLDLPPLWHLFHCHDLGELRIRSILRNLHAHEC